MIGKQIKFSFVVWLKRTVVVWYWETNFVTTV